MLSIFKRLFNRKEKEEIPVKRKEKLSRIPRVDPIRNFHNMLVNLIEWELLQDEEYALWHPCDKDPACSKSPIIHMWTTIYAITSEYGTYIVADLLKILKLNTGESSRHSLPKELEAYACHTSDNTQVVLSFSRDRGIRFHFSKSTDFGNRILFLEKFHAYCKAYKDRIDKRKGQKDADSFFTEGWKHALRIAELEEERNGLSGIGMIQK